MISESAENSVVKIDGVCVASKRCLFSEGVKLSCELVSEMIRFPTGVIVCC